LHERLERSARMHFDSLSRLEQKHCFCAAKTFARLDRANNFPLFVRVLGQIWYKMRNRVRYKNRASQ